MNIDRRHHLFAVAAVATTTSQRAQGYKQERRVSQQELDGSIRLHAMWLADMNTGQRCTFGGRDLSGLQFGVLGGKPVNLSGADFARSDLSETKTDDLRMHHSNFNGANFDGCRWRRPVYVLHSKASFDFSCPIGFDSKTWRNIKPIFGALHQAQLETGRFRFYGYLAAGRPAF